jgi:hypothetical protein
MNEKGDKKPTFSFYPKFSAQECCAKGRVDLGGQDLRAQIYGTQPKSDHPPSRPPKHSTFNEGGFRASSFLAPPPPPLRGTSSLNADPPINHAYRLPPPPSKQTAYRLLSCQHLSSTHSSLHLSHFPFPVPLIISCHVSPTPCRLHLCFCCPHYAYHNNLPSASISSSYATSPLSHHTSTLVF